MSDLTFSLLNPQQGDSQKTLLDRIAFNSRYTDVETLLIAGARTASTVTSVVDMRGCTGAILTLNISAASGTGGLRIQWGVVDPVDQVTYEWSYLLGTAKVNTGILQAQFCPGVVNDAANTATPSVARIVCGFAKFAVIHGDASSYTYALNLIRLK